MALSDDNDLHETAQTIVSVARDIIEERGESALRVTEVAQKSGVAISLLYHHFSDRADLIAHVRAQQFAEIAEVDVANVADAVDTETSSDQLLTRAIENFGLLDDDRRRQARWQRLAILAAAQHNDTLRSQVGTEQRRLNQEIVDVITKGQEQGLISTAVSARAIALFVEAVPLGVVLSDLNPDTAPTNEEWQTLVATVLAAFAVDD